LFIFKFILFFCFNEEFRDAIRKQVEKELHTDSQPEAFVAYVLTGLELFKLNNF
jgi:hypothetical protein